MHWTRIMLGDVSMYMHKRPLTGSTWRSTRSTLTAFPQNSSPLLPPLRNPDTTAMPTNRPSAHASRCRTVGCPGPPLRRPQEQGAGDGQLRRGGAAAHAGVWRGLVTGSSGGEVQLHTQVRLVPRSLCHG